MAEQDLRRDEKTQRRKKEKKKSKKALGPASPSSEI
jgi:hypothetical protein